MTATDGGERFEEFTEEVEFEPTGKPGTANEAAVPGISDPAHAAIHIMLVNALHAAELSYSEASRAGAVYLVELPDCTWAELAREEWRTLIWRGERYLNGDHHRYINGPAWVAWAPTEKATRHHEVFAAELFAKSLSVGSHCVGFAADPSWLPRDLVHAADVRLRIAKLTPEDVGVLAAALCGDTCAKVLSVGQAADLTPRLLRLARRPGQGADDYLRKMEDLLNAEIKPTVAGVADTPRTRPGLHRLHGMPEAIEWGLGVAEDLLLYKAGRLPWSEVGGQACLLSGAPGCGKTLYAQSLAASCGIPLVTGSYSQWLGSGGAHQGSLLKAMQKTFSDARECQPSILLIDEIDSFPNRAELNHSHPEWDIQVVNGLLAEVDGVGGREGVVLVAACNHPHLLDPALVRSGRLDRHIRIPPLNRSSMVLVLREHLTDDLVGEDLSLPALAATGMTGADCERIVRGARRRARVEMRGMHVADLLAEIGGAETRSPEDLQVAAVHEAGHAVATHALRSGTLEAVSILSTVGRGGSVHTANRNSVFSRKGDIDVGLLLLLAGRAAEHEILGEATSGSGGRLGSDLAQASELAALADSALGFSVEGSLVWRGFPEGRRLPETFARDAPLSERVRLWLDDVYLKARDLVRSRRGAVELVAALLLERRILDGSEVEAILNEFFRHPGDGR